MTRTIVVGVGHCGTRWMADVLTAAGVPCTHETTFGSSILDDGWEADSSLAAWPNLGDYPDARVVWVVRDPDRVVRGWLNSWCFADECPGHHPGAHRQSGVTRWIESNVPGVNAEPDEISRVVRYVIEANQKIREALTDRDHVMVSVEDLAEGHMVVAPATYLGLLPEVLVEAATGTPYGPRLSPHPERQPFVELLDLSRHRLFDELVGVATEWGYV